MLTFEYRNLLHSELIPTAIPESRIRDYARACKLANEEIQADRGCAALPAPGSCLRTRISFARDFLQKGGMRQWSITLCLKNMLSCPYCCMKKQGLIGMHLFGVSCQTASAVPAAIGACHAVAI